MIICHCFAVNDVTVAAAAIGAVGADGSIDVEVIASRCGAGADCGSCLESIVDIAARSATASPLLAG